MELGLRVVFGIVMIFGSGLVMIFVLFPVILGRGCVHVVLNDPRLLLMVLGRRLVVFSLRRFRVQPGCTSIVLLRWAHSGPLSASIQIELNERQRGAKFTWVSLRPCEGLRQPPRPAMTRYDIITWPSSSQRPKNTRKSATFELERNSKWRVGGLAHLFLPSPKSVESSWKTHFSPHATDSPLLPKPSWTNNPQSIHQEWTNHPTDKNNTIIDFCKAQHASKAPENIARKNAPLASYLALQSNSKFGIPGLLCSF